MKKPLLLLLLTSIFSTVLLPGHTRDAGLYHEEVVLQRTAAIYPNPVKDFLYIEVNAINPEWAGNSDLQFEIRNILGNMMPVAVERVEQNTYRIDTNSYPDGYYVLMIQCKSCNDSGERYKNSFKFLKQ